MMEMNQLPVDIGHMLHSTALQRALNRLHWNQRNKYA